MAYEVIKTIRGRGYRYRVEGVRDPQTGKRRNRWTYLGRVDGSAPAPAPPRPRGDARRRLLDALETLLESRDYAGLTADAVAAQAGLAHGTFYRHFRDKREALLAAFERLRERRGPIIASLVDQVSDPQAARAGLRAVVAGALRAPTEHPGLARAYFGLALRDPQVRAEWRERRGLFVRRLAAHLDALARSGLADLSDPQATAAALFAMLDGFNREALVEGALLDEARIAAAEEVTERAVFGRLARREAHDRDGHA